MYPVISWHLWGILILSSFDQKQKPFESVLEEINVSYTRITHLLRIIHSRTPEYDLACNPFSSAYSHRLTEVKISLYSWCPSDKTLPIASEYGICNPAVATNLVGRSDPPSIHCSDAYYQQYTPASSWGMLVSSRSSWFFFLTRLKYLTQRFRSQSSIPDRSNSTSQACHYSFWYSSLASISKIEPQQYCILNYLWIPWKGLPRRNSRSWVTSSSFCCTRPEKKRRNSTSPSFMYISAYMEYKLRTT